MLTPSSPGSSSVSHVAFPAVDEHQLAILTSPIGFVFYIVTRESIFFANLRQAYLLSPLYASRISSRTVLFMSVPESHLTKAQLFQVFGDSVNRIWIVSDCSKLEELIQKRDKLAYRLEDAETMLLKSANAAWLGAIARSDAESALGASAGGHGGQSDPDSAPWAMKIKRPTHRL